MKIHKQEDGTMVVAPSVKEIPKIPYDGRRRLDNWITGFLDYTDIIDVPVDFLRWTAISTVAGAAQRKIYMDMGHFDIHSNLYVVLVGPPGTKKSTAIRTGKRLLKKIGGVNLTSDAPSIPGILEDFKDIPQKDHQSLNAFILELSTLYENAKEAMTEFLTAMYDCDPDYSKRTRIGGKEHIAAPWLNLLAGTTPSWIGRNIGDNELEGGLEARKINVFSDERILRSARPKLTARHKEFEVALTHDLARIAQLQGSFDFEGGESGIAFRWYDEWYQDHRERASAIEKEQGYPVRGKPESRFPRVSDYRVDGYFNRKHTHIIKVAMAVSLARKDELVLTMDDLMIAKALLESVEPGMIKVYSSVGGNTYMTDIERIHTQLRQAGSDGLLYSEILAANLHSLEKRYLDDALDCLVKMGDATKIPDMKVQPPEPRFFAQG